MTMTSPDAGAERRAMARMDLTPVPVHPEFAIKAEVSEAAGNSGIILIIKEGLAYLACEHCGQSVTSLRVNGGSYWLTSATIAGGVLTHLIQTHGWTRETIGATNSGPQPESGIGRG